MKKNKILPLLISTLALVGSSTAPLGLTSCKSEDAIITLQIEHGKAERNKLTIPYGEKWGSVKPNVDPDTGYHFVKWVDKDGNEIPNNFVIKKSFAATAVCSIDVFTVFFNANNGELQDKASSKEIEYGKTWREVLPNVNPNEGFEFDNENNWLDSNGQKLDIDKKIVSADSVVADCQHIKLEVRFHADEHCTLSDDSIEINYGDNWGKIVKPTAGNFKDGYAFICWKDNEGKEISDPSLIIKDNMDVYAYCEPKGYNIYLRTENCTLSTSLIMAEYHTTWRKALSQISVAPSEGYEFNDKWVDLKHNKIKLDSQITASTSVIAICDQISLSVNFSHDDYCSLSSERKDTILYGDNWGSVNKPDVLNITTGYVFDGWYDNDGNKLDDDFKIKQDNFKVTAKCKKDTIDLYLETKNGMFKETGASSLVISGEYGLYWKDVLPEVQPDDNYQFDRWEDGNGNVIDLDSQIIFDSDKTSNHLIAICVKKRIKITFTHDEHCSLESDQPYMVSYGDIWSKVVAPNVYVTDGFHFVKWVDENGKELTPSYKIEDDFNARAISANNIITLHFAVSNWDAIGTFEYTEKTIEYNEQQPTYWDELLPQYTIKDVTKYQEAGWINLNTGTTIGDRQTFPTESTTAQLQIIPKKINVKFHDSEFCHVQQPGKHPDTGTHWMDVVKPQMTFTPGYELSYWTRDPVHAEEKKYNDLDIISIQTEGSDNIDAYPICKKIEHTVQFNIVNGYIDFYSSTFEYGTKWKDILKPTEEDSTLHPSTCYYFNYWVDQDGNVIDDETEIKDDLKATAICDNNYDITITLEDDNIAKLPEGQQPLMAELGDTWGEIEKPEVTLPANYSLKWVFGSGENKGMEIPESYRIEDDFTAVATGVLTTNEIQVPEESFRQETSWIITNQDKLETIFAGFTFTPDTVQSHTGDWTAEDLEVSIRIRNGYRYLNGCVGKVINFKASNDGESYRFDVDVYSTDKSNIKVGDQLKVEFDFTIKYDEPRYVAVGWKEDEACTIDVLKYADVAGELLSKLEIPKVIHRLDFEKVTPMHFNFEKQTYIFFCLQARTISSVQIFSLLNQDGDIDAVEPQHVDDVIYPSQTIYIKAPEITTAFLSISGIYYLGSPYPN